MKTGIIVSSKDSAGLNIKEKFIENHNFTKINGGYRNENVYKLDDKIKLYTTDLESVYNEDTDKEIDADMFVFATKHQSESGIPSFSVHSPGNWGKADFGGEDKKLCVAPANLLKKAMKLLEENKIEGFEVIQECTHHGPYMDKPCMFIEIGSSEKEWGNEKAGEVIAKVIFELLTTKTKEFKSALGIGGPHHTPNFKKVILESDVAVGHVCPKYNLENLDKEMISQAIEKTIPKAELVILDWKGLGEHKQRIVDILNEIGVEAKRTKEF